MAKRRHSQRCVLSLLMAFWISALPLAAQNPQNARDVDYASARSEIERFGMMISNVINASFNSSPFALVQKPKGVYLQSYGMTFQFVINIHRAVLDTPFGPMRQGNDVSPELKRRRIDDLKEKLIQMVKENGPSLRQLRKEDAISIVAFFEDRNIPDEPNENKTIIISVLKKDLDDLAGKEDRFNEFRQRIKIIEY
jgi:hypothetical protein